MNADAPDPLDAILEPHSAEILLRFGARILADQALYERSRARRDRVHALAARAEQRRQAKEFDAAGG